MTRIFPLPDVVLFPGVPLPLHVFEPRYRQMTADALADDRRIGIVAVRPEHLAEIAGDPPVFDVGCTGVIAHEQRLVDGRYTFVLHGAQRFRIVREPERPADRLYRVVEAALLEDPMRPEEATPIAALRLRLLDLLRALVPDFGRTRGPLGGSLLGDADDATLLHTVCQFLGIPIRERQSLLEADGVLARFRLLIHLLEGRATGPAARGESSSGTLH